MAQRVCLSALRRLSESAAGRRAFSAAPEPASRFEQHIDVKPTTANTYGCFIRPEYNVVAIPNGGLTSSIALKAAMTEVGGGMVPVSATTHFHAMADSDAEGEVNASVTSRSRAQAAVRTELLQGGQIKADTYVVFADPARLRGPQYFDQALQPPALPPLERCAEPGSMQPFVPLRDMYDVRLPQDAQQGGNLFELFTAAMRAAHAGQGMDAIDPSLFSSSARLEGYIAHSSHEPIHMHHLGFFADCLPPPMVQMKCAVGNWVPTLQLSVYFRGTPLAAGAPHISERSAPYAAPERGQAAQWLRFRFVTRCISNGVCDIDGELWDETDSLVAQSRQLARLIPPPKR